MLNNYFNCFIPKAIFIPKYFVKIGNLNYNLTSSFVFDKILFN